ncbi:RES domain-containing protein [Parashewanella tropica]|uniref:RES domain-containing protein n=1 Tax=Parashewanella tropica TaxID=2547970 RepID=UPI00105A146C|nr:RES domain-containing protein [Parashewanella tropica]
MNQQVLSLNYIDQISSNILESSDPTYVENSLRHVLDFYDLVNYELSYDRTYWRARKCDHESGFKNISELGCPPKHLVSAGRLNEPNSPMLYVSPNQFSVLEEIGAEVNDYIHMIAYRQNQEQKLRCGIVGEITQVQRWGTGLISDATSEQINRVLNEMTHEVAKSFVFADAFLSSILKDPNAKNSNYLHSRVLSKILLEKNEFIDAIVYPSVALESARNFAIKPDVANKKLSIASNFVLRINKKYKYGMYDFEVIKMASGQYGNGAIAW